MPKVRMEMMFLEELEAEIERSGIAYVPCGSLEWHGPQLTVGCDYLRAGPLCERAAGETGGVVLPPMWVASAGYFAFQGSIVFSGELVTRFAAELLRELEKMGFRLAVFFLGHGGPVQEECFEKAVTEWGADRALRGMVIPSRLPSAPCGNAHAGLWETATALAAEPASTDMTRYTPERRVLPRYRVPDYEPYKQGLSPAGRADIDKWTAFPGWNYDPDMGEKVSPAQGEAWLAEEAHNLAVAVQAAADAAR